MYDNQLRTRPSKYMNSSTQDYVSVSMDQQQTRGSRRNSKIKKQSIIQRFCGMKLSKIKKLMIYLLITTVCCLLLYMIYLKFYLNINIFESLPKTMYQTQQAETNQREFASATTQEEKPADTEQIIGKGASEKLRSDHSTKNDESPAPI